MNSVKRNFFELGIAFAQFSAKPDQEKYENTYNIALSLELEFPIYNDLKDKPWWDFVPPAKWFIGSDGKSFRNCYEIGKLAYLRFILALPPNPNTRTGQIIEAEQKLGDLFEEENVAPEVLDDYLTSLADGSSEVVNASLKTFVQNFAKALSSDESDNEQIFDNLRSAPSAFYDDVLKALQETINEASVCYKHECYLATIVLCGKIIETLLANAYQVVFEEPPDDETGFGTVRRKLRQKGILLDKSVQIQLDLIYVIRSAAIHGKTKIPTQDDAKGIAILTQSVINIIYDYFN